MPYEYLRESFRVTLRDTMNRRIKLIIKNAEKLAGLLGDTEILGAKNSYDSIGGYFYTTNWSFNREERRLIKSICTRLDFVAETVLYYSHGVKV